MTYREWADGEGKNVEECAMMLDLLLPESCQGMVGIAVRTAYFAGQKSVETDTVNDIPRQRQETIEAMHELVNSVMRGPK